jgi:spermidine synthase
MMMEQRARYWSLVIALSSTGAAFIIYEIVLLRELVIVLGGTVFASSAVLTGVMFGLFVGGYWLGAVSSRSRSPVFVLVAMEIGMAATAIYIVFIARSLQSMDSWILRYVLALLCVIPTAVLAGGELPVATHLIGEVVDRERLGNYSGKLYAADTLGAMVGGLAGPLWLMGTIGALKSTWVAGLLNSLSAIVILLIDDSARALPSSQKRWLWIFALAVMGMLGLGILFPLQPFDTQLMASGIVHEAKKVRLSARVLEVNETLYQRAVIVERKPVMEDISSRAPMGALRTLYGAAHKALYINGNYQVDTLYTPVYYDETVYLTLMSHPNPERVLVIGCGDGGLLRAILADPRVKQINQVEIDRGIIRLCQYHMPEINQRLGKSVWDDPRVRLHIDDGRRFLKRSTESYSLIVCDLPGPLEEATSMFYSREFYRLVKNHLDKDGVFWTESESPRSLDTPLVVARTVSSIFGDDSTRLVQPFQSSQRGHRRGEVVVVASVNPAYFERGLKTVSRSYALLDPPPKWINPENHIRWLNEGRLHLRWNAFGVSTDDKPIILYVPPKSLRISS